MAKATIKLLLLNASSICLTACSDDSFSADLYDAGSECHRNLPTI